jgi:alkylation response protein AidB-like acyl-CoA dehydrogenase
MAALAQGGFYGLCIDTSFGGQGQGPGAFAAVVEELARHCSSTAMVYVMHIAAAKVIETSTTLSTRADVLRTIAEGKHLTTFALSERSSRSQFWAPVSQLVEQGNGYQTHAFKSWSTAAHHADSYVASAQRPGAQSPLDFTLYLLPRTRPGVQYPDTFNRSHVRSIQPRKIWLKTSCVSWAMKLPSWSQRELTSSSSTNQS